MVPWGNAGLRGGFRYWTLVPLICTREHTALLANVWRGEDRPVDCFNFALDVKDSVTHQTQVPVYYEVASPQKSHVGKIHELIAG